MADSLMIFITLVYRWCVSIIGEKKSSERFDLHSAHSKDNFINYFYNSNLGIWLFPEHIYSLLHSTLNTQSCVYKGVIWNRVPHRGYKIQLSSLADKTGEQTNNYDMIFYLFLLLLFYCSGFCHTLTWISHGFTCVPHPDPPSHLPLHLLPLGLPSAPGPSTCLMHPTWAGDLFHPR